MSQVLREAAQSYLDSGWVVLPVLHKGKAPGVDGRPLPEWQKLRLQAGELPRYFDPPGNVGVLLGEPSGWLVDVDLDCLEAIELAPLVLRPTLTFGRPSKPRSHWLYVSENARSAKYRGMPTLNAGGKETFGTLVELRGGNESGHGSSGQTVFPPSVHVSGEPISWSEDADGIDKPVVERAAELERRVLILAQASLLAQASGVAAARAWLARGPYDAPPAVRARCLAMAGRWPDPDLPPVPLVPTPPRQPGQRLSVNEAVDAYNRAHPRQWKKSGGTCPICGHKGCFGGVRGSMERWSCFSASHPAVGVKVRAEGTDCWTGDALDLDAHEAGVSRIALLRREGLLT